jgi:arylsulfatase A-like enzyme
MPRGPCHTPTTRSGASFGDRDLGSVDNTLVIYIQGDNGASAEGRLKGLYNELTVLNGIEEDFRPPSGTWTNLGDL